MFPEFSNDNESRGREREETLGHGPSVGIESKVRILLSLCGAGQGQESGWPGVTPGLRLFSEQGPLHASQGQESRLSALNMLTLKLLNYSCVCLFCYI